MFDNFFFSPFSVTVGFVRAKEFVRPHISDDVLTNEVVKGDVFEFVGLGHKRNWILLCDSQYDWFYFVVMYKIHMPHANDTKKV